jgi:hypothetical protein
MPSSPPSCAAPRSELIVAYVPGRGAALMCCFRPGTVAALLAILQGAPSRRRRAASRRSASDRRFGPGPGSYKFNQTWGRGALFRHSYYISRQSCDGFTDRTVGRTGPGRPHNSTLIFTRPRRWAKMRRSFHPWPGGNGHQDAFADRRSNEWGSPQARRSNNDSRRRLRTRVDNGDSRRPCTR